MLIQNGIDPCDDTDMFGCCHSYDGSFEDLQEMRAWTHEVLRLLVEAELIIKKTISMGFDPMTSRLTVSRSTD